MMIEPDEERNLTPSAPLGPPPLTLFGLDGPLALMPGPLVEPVAAEPVAPEPAVAAEPALAAEPAVAAEPVAATPLVAEPAPVVEPRRPGPLPVAVLPLVSTASAQPRRARSALELVLISVVLGTLLAAAIGIGAAVVVALVNHAVGSSSTTP
jgi:cell division protein ZipA